jgi:hypothetical protein
VRWWKTGLTKTGILYPFRLTGGSSGEADFLGDGNTDFVLENTIYQDMPTSKFDPSHTIWL